MDIAERQPVRSGRVRPPYTGPDPRTREQKAADVLHKKAAILDVMSRTGAPDDPGSIARAAADAHGYPLRASLGRGGFRPGPGTIVSNMIRTLDKAGLIGFSWRRLDGLSGSAYIITDAGRAFLDQHRAILSEPWNDPACYGD